VVGWFKLWIVKHLLLLSCSACETRWAERGEELEVCAVYVHTVWAGAKRGGGGKVGSVVFFGVSAGGSGQAAAKRNSRREKRRPRGDSKKRLRRQTHATATRSGFDWYN
jgi:hypothetical protein